MSSDTAEKRRRQPNKPDASLVDGQEQQVEPDGKGKQKQARTTKANSSAAPKSGEEGKNGSEGSGVRDNQGTNAATGASQESNLSMLFQQAQQQAQNPFLIPPGNIMYDATGAGWMKISQPTQPPQQQSQMLLLDPRQLSSLPFNPMMQLQSALAASTANSAATGLNVDPTNAVTSQPPAQRAEQPTPSFFQSPLMVNPAGGQTLLAPTQELARNGFFQHQLQQPILPSGSNNGMVWVLQPPPAAQPTPPSSPP
jgi:hypothetical protein